MAVDEIRETLRYLTKGDMAALLELAASETFASGDLILKLDEPARGIMILRDGFVVIERTYPQGQIALARCGPGQVIGEVSFVDDSGATADVRADGPVTMDVIAKKDIETLLASDSGLSSRFYRSLAAVLATRLKRSTKRISELSSREAIELDQLHTPQTGQVTARQLPDDLLDGVHQFDEAMRALEAKAREGAAEPSDLDSEVSKSCDQIVALLGSFTDDQTLLEITYDDLLAFRDETQVGMGIGDTVFRETYAFLMTSATVARCYMKPRGFSDDHETIQRIYENEPEGDGRLGASIDRWFLSGPLCTSRRTVRDMVITRVEKALGRRSKRKDRRITCLAAGHASEIFDLLSGKTAADVQITCVDRDNEALLAVAERVQRRDCTDQVKLLQACVMRLARGEDTCALPPQDAIYAIGLCDYLEDDELIQLINWAHAQLAAGAPLILTGLHPNNPDRVFMEYMLDMKLHHRSEKELRSLFKASAFAGRAPTISRDETKTGLVAVCSRAG